MTPDFKINGRVVEKESGRPLRRLAIRAYDKDFLFDDLVGSATTDGNGRFLIHYSAADFSELFARRPDLYFVVSVRETEAPVHTTLDAIRWSTGRDETVEIARWRTHTHYPAPETSFSTLLAKRAELRPGAYDLIARVTQPGEHLRDEQRLRDSDFISDLHAGRRATAAEICIAQCSFPIPSTPSLVRSNNRRFPHS